MRILAILALLGLWLNAASAQTRDLAAEPAYPADVSAAPRAKATGAAKRPAPKAAAKGRVQKPAAAKPAASASVDVRLPKPKPEASSEAAASISDIKVDSRFGWNVVIDPATGIRLGVPGKLATETREAKNGTRWSSRHGEVVIETFRIKTSDSLSALFDAQKKEPASRRIESSYTRPDGFFLSGLQGLKQFAVRAQIKNGELRGYTMLYDQAMAGIMLPVLPAMANAFAPFPDGVTAIARLARPVSYGSGVVVSAAGDIITDRRFSAGCDVVTIPGLGNADRIAADEAHGLALLRVYGKHNLKPAQLASGDAMPAELTLVGVPDPHVQNGGSERAEIKAQLAGGNAIRLRDSVPVAGLSGAAALDARGRVLGIMETQNAQLASAQPAAPPVRLIPTAAIRDFLAANAVTPPADADGGRLSVVRVICVRH